MKWIIERKDYYNWGTIVKRVDRRVILASLLPLFLTIVWTIAVSEEAPLLFLMIAVGLGIISGIMMFGCILASEEITEVILNPFTVHEFKKATAPFVKYGFEWLFMEGKKHA